jgi:hypothetical protein
MNNKQLMKISSLVLLSTISLSGYATSHGTVTTDSAPIQQQTYSISSIDSGRATLSSVRATKRKGGHAVTGNVRIKTMQRHLMRLPGKIIIELKSADGEVLETVKARFHQMFGHSKVAHFDGILKTMPPAGSQIVVRHTVQ